MSDELQPPCRNCGLQNQPGRDFCEGCGEYISWAPTRQIAAVQAHTVPDEAAIDDAEESAGSVAADEERDRRGRLHDDDEAQAEVDADGDGDGADGPAGSGSGEILVRRPG